MLIALNEVEQEALLACSHEAVRLYVLLLRPKMDMATYTVGKVVPISRGGLALDMVYRPPRGSHKAVYQPTVKQVRGLLDELEEAGLLSNQSVCRSRESWQLVFGFPLARALVRVREEGPLKGRPHGQDEGRDEGMPESGAVIGVAGYEGPDDGLNEGPLKGRQEGPISGFLGTSSVNGNSSGTSDRTGSAKSPALPSREINLVKMLRGQGVEITPAQIRHVKYQQALQQPDADWLAAVATAKIRKGGQRLQGGYLLPILEEIRLATGPDAPGVVVGKAGKQWFETWSGIEAKASELGLVQGRDEAAPYFKARVYEAAGVTRQDLRVAQVDGGAR